MKDCTLRKIYLAPDITASLEKKERKNREHSSFNKYIQNVRAGWTMRYKINIRR